MVRRDITSFCWFINRFVFYLQWLQNPNSSNSSNFQTFQTFQNLQTPQTLQTFKPFKIFKLLKPFKLSNPLNPSNSSNPSNFQTLQTLQTFKLFKHGTQNVFFTPPSWCCRCYAYVMQQTCIYHASLKERNIYVTDTYKFHGKKKICATSWWTGSDIIPI